MKDLCNEIKFKEQRKGDLQKKKNNMRIREILDRNAAKDEVVTACIWQLWLGGKCKSSMSGGGSADVYKDLGSVSSREKVNNREMAQSNQLPSHLGWGRLCCW